MVIYEDKSAYDLWIKALLSGIVALLFVVAIILLSIGELEGGLVMLGAAVFDALLFKLILPEKFQVFPDRLRIKLGGPFGINIKFANIKETRHVSGAKMFVYGGLRFATSSKYIVEIVRRKGLSVVFSPASGEVFLEQLRQAMEGSRLS